MKLSIIGLGKLGAPMAAVMAHKGHTVVGMDVNPAYVAAIQQGQAPVNEPRLAEMIQANRARLSATTDCEKAILATEASFIIVPTPSCTRWHLFDALCNERRGEDRRPPSAEKGAGTWWCSRARSCRALPVDTCCRCSKTFPASDAVRISAYATIPSLLPWAA